MEGDATVSNLRPALWATPPKVRPLGDFDSNGGTGRRFSSDAGAGVVGAVGVNGDNATPLLRVVRADGDGDRV